ncbi:MAG TPA: HEAT repeat domain-containing protein [Myxococcaceae bacterium]|nr:HEAT repeat domain-containing protein [Myxococcaceae bacterium]
MHAARIALVSTLFAATVSAAQEPRPRPDRDRTPSPLPEMLPHRFELPELPTLVDEAFAALEFEWPAMELAMADAAAAFEQLDFELPPGAWDISPDMPDFDVELDFDLDLDFARHFDVDIGFDRFDAVDVRDAAPPNAWAPQDPADSLYRLAREALTRGENRRAADLFRQITERHPRSAYAADALYWQAFALHRLGSEDDLRSALAALDAQRARYAGASTQADAQTLRTRIRGALAARGDDRSARYIESAAEARGRGTSCDKEELAVRIEALNALGQMDPDAAGPLLRRVVSRRDECSAGLRKRAVFLLGRRGDEAAGTLTDVARNDPDPDVRRDAILWLSKMPGDQTVATLEELARTGDGRVQRASVRALVEHASPRARQALRSLVEGQDVPESVRSEAISTLGDTKRATDEDAAWLRAVYARLDSDRLKEKVVAAIARLGGPENEAWVMAFVRNANEPIKVRSEALAHLASSRSRRERAPVDVAVLVRMYDALEERELRERLIQSFARRNEPQATDKLLEIARSGTDPRLRRTAISALTRKDDPRTQKLLLEIIDQ